MSSKQMIVRLQLDSLAKEAVDRLCEQRGLIQIDLLSHLLCWFVYQDEIVQGAILGLPAEAAGRESAARLLRRIAETQRPK